MSFGLTYLDFISQNISLNGITSKSTNSSVFFWLKKNFIILALFHFMQNKALYFYTSYLIERGCFCSNNLINFVQLQTLANFRKISISITNIGGV